MRLQRKSLLLPLLFVALAVPASLLAAPRGVVLAPVGLTEPDRARLRLQVANTRKRDPRAFEALAALRVKLPRLAARQRGRLVTAVLPLRAMGQRALMPMLAELALDARPRGGLTTRAWQGWRVSLLEALGSLRDARSRPVLEAILSSVDPTADRPIFRGAAVALGRLGDDRAAAKLVRLARRTRPRRMVLPGLGQCRRASVARELAAILSQATDNQALATETAAALGQVANLWAWKTPAVAKSGEGSATRMTALRALVANYPLIPAGAREAAVKAIKLVGHDKTLPTITAARMRTSGAARAALDALARRITAEGVLR